MWSRWRAFSVQWYPGMLQQGRPYRRWWITSLICSHIGGHRIFLKYQISLGVSKVVNNSKECYQISVSVNAHVKGHVCISSARRQKGLSIYLKQYPVRPICLKTDDMLSGYPSGFSRLYNDRPQYLYTLLHLGQMSQIPVGQGSSYTCTCTTEPLWSSRLHSLFD